MLKNNFSDYLIARQGSSIAADGLTLELWLPWYRTLPLSVLEVAELLVDGQRQDLSSAELAINGRRFPLSALAELTSEEWFVQDSAYLHVPAVTASGAPRSVELQFNLYPPYIPMLTWVTRGAITLEQGH